MNGMKAYEAPSLEWLSVSIENGFAASPSTGGSTESGGGEGSGGWSEED